MKPARRSGSVQGERTTPGLRRFDTIDLAAELTTRMRTDPPRPGQWSVLRYLGMLHAELDLHCQLAANRFSPASSMLMLQQSSGHPDFSPEVIRGATCVDVGCGGLNPLGGLLTMLLAGARRGIAVDPAEPRLIPQSVRALFHLAARAWAGGLTPLLDVEGDQVLERLRGFDLSRIALGDSAGIDVSRLEFRQTSIQEAGLRPGSVEFLYSRSFFEHVADPRGVVEATARIVRSGGLAVHSIDGGDHRHYADPEIGLLEFLREESDEPLVHNCNRVRPAEFRQLFQDAGFQERGVRVIDSIELSDEFVDSLAEPFRSKPREVLEPVRMLFFLRRH
jgi:SAM-dependent methyltransferase